MRVMLIDDSKAMRALQRSVLADLGHTQIEEATDGQDALSKVGAFNPDVILLDWDMPRMDGLTFVRRFRQTNRTTPLIMVTTECERSRVLEAIKAGVSGYVVKPFTPEQLGRRVTEALSRTRAA
jgi:two-component system chemotaxis response regulator CheY